MVGTDGEPVLDLPETALAVLRADQYDSIYYRVTDVDGHLVAGDSDLPSPPSPRSNEGTTRGDARYRGEPIRVVSYHAASTAGPVTITVGETLHKRARARANILSTTLAVDFGEFGVVLAMILLGVGIALNPLRSVEAQIAERSAKDLSPLPLQSVPVEIRSVVEALNRLFQTVRTTGEAQRRFLESAAHQLRTPLTGISAQLELMTADEPDSLRRKRLAAVLEGAHRLTHTTQQLLTLARSDQAANLNWDFAPVDLEALVESVISDRLAAADIARVDLGAEIEPAAVRGVGWLLTEALGNLANNAIAHTPPGGTVTLHCGSREGRPFLRVVDTGVGIPPGERQRVMDRFFRASNSRGGGSGLGLAIVREVAQLHSATVSIDGGPDGKGTSVELLF